MPSKANKKYDDHLDQVDESWYLIKHWIKHHQVFIWDEIYQFFIWNQTLAYLPTPGVQKSGEVQESLHCKNVIFNNVWMLSKNHQKAFQMFSTSITAWENRANFLPCIVQFDWLNSDQLWHSLNIYHLCFVIENSSNKNTRSTSCIIFLLDISKIMKLMKTFWKRPW